MTKEELVILLDSLEIKVNESIQNDMDIKIYPRIVYWEFLWEPLIASDIQYNMKVTYQVSFFSQTPRNLKLLELKKKLNDKKIFPVIEHEYIIEEKHFHSYFSIEVLENV